MPEGSHGFRGFRPWREAWGDALYGARGFYRRDEGPQGHFETSANAAGGAVELLAQALLTLADRHGCTQVVDVGAGRGELLQALASAAPLSEAFGSAHATVEPVLTGVDVVRRPAGLPDRVRWLEAGGGPRLPDELRDLDRTLVIANEWLDVVPCDVLEADAQGVLRVVEVDGAGRERLGAAASAEQATWSHQWWPQVPEADPDPDGQPGRRVEVGLAREAAWADLLARVRSGVVVAVDYGHLAADRPPQGTLAAHRSGHLVPPVPDGSCDLTADVAWDSLLAAGTAAMRQRRVIFDASLPHCEPDAGRGGPAGGSGGSGGSGGLATARLVTQRAALAELGVDAARPSVGGDPAAYLTALQRASAAALLVDPGGLGGLGWLVQEVATGQADPPPARVEP